MDLNEFVEKFSIIRSSGFIPSKRKGPTGVGHTLEHALGITENNITSPDLGEIELKSHRERTSSLITLFTFNRKAWKMPPLEAIRKKIRAGIFCEKRLARFSKAHIAIIFPLT